MGCKRHVQCEVYVCAECRNEALDVLMAEVEQLRVEAENANKIASAAKFEIDRLVDLVHRLRQGKEQGGESYGTGTEGSGDLPGFMKNRKGKK